MASTVNASISSSTPTINDHSPRHSLSENHNTSRRGGSRVVPSPSTSSPWTQIFRGESDSIAVMPSSPSARDSIMAVALTEQPGVMVSSSSLTTSYLLPEGEGLDDSNGNAGKRPAWSKPSNGAVEVGPVMGAVSWPALSESARASGKPSQDSPKGLADGSSSVPVIQGPASPSSSSQKQVSNNANPNSTPNHTVPARQRSMKRNSANTSSNGGTSQPPGSQPLIGEVHSNNPSPRDHSQRNSQSRSANDHPQQQRNSFRRNGGPHSRGDGSHHHNYGGRRDQDRSNQDWSSHRNFNGRDPHMQQQRVVPRFMRHPPPPPPPPTTAPFIGPPPVRGFGSPIGFHELGSPVYYVAGPPPDPLRGVPFVAAPLPPHAMYFPAPDLQLHSKIVNQIDYYFSNENLIKDTFLRQNMDDQGWVPIKLIAGFNKVSHLTDNVQLILDAIRNSTVVEVQGDKVRRRNDWMRWIMPPSVQFPNVSVPASPGRSSHDMLAAHVHSISLEETASSHSSGRSQADFHNEAFLGRSLSDVNSQLHISSAEGSGWVSVQGGSGASTLARTSSK